MTSRLNARALLLLTALLLAPTALPAQTAARPDPAERATGTITGRVFNPVTGEFVRNAELTVSGRNILNEPIEGFANQPGIMRVVNRYGAAWTVGVRGRW